MESADTVVLKITGKPYGFESRLGHRKETALERAKLDLTEQIRNGKKYVAIDDLVNWLQAERSRLPFTEEGSLKNIGRAGAEMAMTYVITRLNELR